MDVKRASASSADGALLISNLVEANARLRLEVAELEAQLATSRSATNQASPASDDGRVESPQDV